MKLYAKLFALAAMASTVVALGASQSADAAKGPISLVSRPDLVVEVSPATGVTVKNIGISPSGPFKVHVAGGWRGDGCNWYVVGQTFDVPSLKGFGASYPIPAAASFTPRLITADSGNAVFEKNELNNAGYTPSTNC